MKPGLIIITLCLLTASSANAAISMRQRTVAEAAFNNGTVTINVPGGIQNGDLMVLICTDGSGGFNTITGWTRQLNVPSTNGEALALYTRTASSEPASYQCVSTAGVPQPYAMMLGLFDDGGATVAYDTGTTGSGNSTSITAPSLTASGSSDPYEWMIAAYASGTAFLPAEQGTLNFWTGGIFNTFAAGFSYPAATGGASAPTLSLVLGASHTWISLQAAFKVTSQSTQRIMLRGMDSVTAVPNATINVPTNIVDGDLMIGFAAGGSAITTPSGWVSIGSQDSGKYHAYSRTASSEPATYTFTNAATGKITAWFNMDGKAMSGVDTSALNGPTSTASSFAGPTLTTAHAAEVVITDWSDNLTGSVSAGPPSVAMTGPIGSTDANGNFEGAANTNNVLTAGNIAGWFVQPTASITSSRTASTTTSTSTTWYAAQVALVPPPSGQQGWVFPDE